MSETTDSKDAKPKDELYKMKGIPVNAYLNETGEFKWIPTECNDENSIKEMIDVLTKMPEDRREVWGKRLDREITITRCPIIQNKPELSATIDKFLAAHDKKNPKTYNKTNRGEKAK